MARPRTASDADVFAATGRVLRRSGPAGTTLAAVGREAGLSAAALVQRFGSKRALLLAFAAQAGDGVHSCFARSRAENSSPLAALHRALAALVSDIDGPDELANDLGFLQLDLRDAEFRAHAARHARQMRAEIGDLIAAGVAAGELVRGTDPADLARQVQVAYNGVLLLWALDGDRPLTDALHAAVSAVLLPHRPGPRRGPTTKASAS